MGDALAREVAGAAIPGYALWSLGRIGARVPLYGPANSVVHPETAARWVEALLCRSFAPGREAADAVFALSQLARVSGDRARDLDDVLRRSVLDRLKALGADESQVRPVEEYTELAAAQQGSPWGTASPSACD